MLHKLGGYKFDFNVCIVHNSLNLTKELKMTTPDYADLPFTLEVDIDGNSVEHKYHFDFNYTKGYPGKFWGKPEDQYPSEPDEIEIVNVQEQLLNGDWIDVDYVGFEDELIEAAKEELANARESYIDDMHQHKDELQKGH